MRHGGAGRSKGRLDHQRRTSRAAPTPSRIAASMMAIPPCDGGGAPHASQLADDVHAAPAGLEVLVDLGQLDATLGRAEHQFDRAHRTLGRALTENRGA